MLSCRPAVLATVCSGREAGYSVRLQPPGGGATPSTMQEQIQAEAHSVAALQQPALIRHGTAAGVVSVFYDYIRPAPRLLLIGIEPSVSADRLPAQTREPLN